MMTLVRILKLSFLGLVLLTLNVTLSSANARNRHGKAFRRAKTERVAPHGKNSRAASNKQSKLNSRSARLSRRQRAAEARRAVARRRAEAARRAAIARQRAQDQAMRDKAQRMIAKDDTTGEDLEIRRAAIEALGDHAGTVVVLNPQTGRVYSIVNQEWALREGFKPCSTIKLVTGLAGLNEGVIDSADTTSISEKNQVDLTRALAYSKNGYFQQVGGQVGFEKMISYARQLGLGEKTGINARNEFQGRLPALKSGFALNRMSSHGDDFEVTAVQLATLVSAIANGGKLLTPFVARTQQDDARFKPNVRRQVSIDPNIWQYMIPGMVGAVNYGSGRKAYDPAATIVGKTGTCIEQGTWVGLFTSYAPLSDPRLAIVVIARGTDGRSHFPAAVAGRIYRELNGRLGANVNLQIAGTSFSNGTAGVESVLQDDDEEEASAETDESRQGSGVTAAPKPKNLWRGASAREGTKVKRVLMTIPRRAFEQE